MTITEMTGQSLRDARQDLGLTQEQLANQLGVTLRTIWRWEKGDVPSRMGKKILQEWWETRKNEEGIEFLRRVRGDE